jgi:hypothetical protein
MQRFIFTTGGAYLFQPSITALRRLARPATAPSPAPSPPVPEPRVPEQPPRRPGRERGVV